MTIVCIIPARRSRLPAPSGARSAGRSDDRKTSLDRQDEKREYRFDRNLGQRDWLLGPSYYRTSHALPAALAQGLDRLALRRTRSRCFLADHDRVGFATKRHRRRLYPRPRGGLPGLHHCLRAPDYLPSRRLVRLPVCGWTSTSNATQSRDRAGEIRVGAVAENVAVRGNCQRCFGHNHAFGGRAHAHKRTDILACPHLARDRNLVHRLARLVLHRARAAPSKITEESLTCAAAFYRCGR